MVRALVVKDLMILRHRLFYSLILVALAVAPMPHEGKRGLLGALFTHMVVTAFLTQAALLEEQSRGHVLVSLLPVGRRDVVQARYLLLGGLAAAMATLYTGPIAAIAPFVPAPIPASTVLLWWLWAATLTMLMWSISLPVVFRWGVTRSQILLNSLMFIPFLVLMLLSRWFGAGIQSLARQGLFSSLPAGLGGLAVAVILAWVSSVVSTRLYTRRDL